MRKITLYLTAVLFLFSVMTVVQASSIQDDLSSHITRLHIIANSDSEFDQNIKLKVRDTILEKNPYAPIDIPNHLPELEKIAEEVLIENGVSYGVHAEYGNFQFPRKKYKNITMPAGKYNGVRFILGDGQGQNWWCVMFPPLCFSEGVTGELSNEDLEMLEKALKNESTELITSDDMVIKFRTVELVNSVLQALSKR